MHEEGFKAEGANSNGSYSTECTRHHIMMNSFVTMAFVRQLEREANEITNSSIQDQTRRVERMIRMCETISKCSKRSIKCTKGIGDVNMAEWETEKRWFMEQSEEKLAVEMKMVINDEAAPKLDLVATRKMKDGIGTPFAIKNKAAETDCLHAATVEHTRGVLRLQRSDVEESKFRERDKFLKDLIDRKRLADENSLTPLSLSKVDEVDDEKTRDDTYSYVFDPNATADEDSMPFQEVECDGDDKTELTGITGFGSPDEDEIGKHARGQSFSVDENRSEVSSSIASVASLPDPEILEAAESAAERLNSYFKQGPDDDANFLALLTSEYAAAEEFGDGEIKFLLLDIDLSRVIARYIIDVCRGMRTFAGLERMLSNFARIMNEQRVVNFLAKRLVHQRETEKLIARLEKKFTFPDLTDASTASLLAVFEEYASEGKQKKPQNSTTSVGLLSSDKDYRTLKAIKAAYAEYSGKSLDKCNGREWESAARLSELMGRLLFKLGHYLVFTRVLLLMKTKDAPLLFVHRPLILELLAAKRKEEGLPTPSEEDVKHISLAEVLQMTLPKMRACREYNNPYFQIVRVVENCLHQRESVSYWAISEKVAFTDQILNCSAEYLDKCAAKKDSYMSTSLYRRSESSKSFCSVFHCEGMMVKFGLDGRHSEAFAFGLISLAMSNFRRPEYYFYRDETFFRATEVTNATWIDVAVKVFQRAEEAAKDYSTGNVWVMLSKETSIPLQVFAEYLLQEV